MRTALRGPRTSASYRQQTCGRRRGLFPLGSFGAIEASPGSSGQVEQRLYLEGISSAIRRGQLRSIATALRRLRRQGHPGDVPDLGTRADLRWYRRRRETQGNGNIIGTGPGVVRACTYNMITMSHSPNTMARISRIGPKTHPSSSSAGARTSFCSWITSRGLRLLQILLL